MDVEKAEISQDALPLAVLELFKGNTEPVTKEAIAHVIAALLNFEACVAGATGQTGRFSDMPEMRGPYEAYRNALYAAVSLMLDGSGRRATTPAPTSEPVASA